jgi:serine/threonine-protein kinase HipA
MKRSVKVFFGDDARLIGMVVFEAQGARESVAFVYDAAWLSAQDRYSIDPTLPLVTGPQFHRRTGDGSLFHGAISDTEPDGWGYRVILRDHGKRREAARLAGRAADIPPLNSLDFLLAIDDRSRVGALRFQDESGIFQRAVEDGRRAAPPLIELGHLLSASRAVEEKAETADDLAYLRGRGTSLGGLRPKCTVVDDEGWLSIGKFPSIADERAVTKGEVLAMKLAASAGINAAHARLVPSEDIPVALIRRFDRTRDGRRLMYISAASMLGVDANDLREHAYTEIVDALRTSGSAAQTDIEELWRRIAFSILISNFDDHLRNHGFLHAANGLWRLAPAFDLNPMPERVRELKTWISEDVGPGATISGLRSVAPYFRISTARAAEILRHVEKAVSGWRKAGAAIGMTDSELDQFVDAFEHSERQAAKD